MCFFFLIEICSLFFKKKKKKNKKQKTNEAKSLDQSLIGTEWKMRFEDRLEFM